MEGVEWDSDPVEDEPDNGSSVDMAERLVYKSRHYDGRVSCIEHFCCPFAPADGSTPVSSITTWQQMLHPHSIYHMTPSKSMTRASQSRVTFFKSDAATLGCFRICTFVTEGFRRGFWILSSSVASVPR